MTNRKHCSKHLPVKQSKKKDKSGDIINKIKSLNGGVHKNVVLKENDEVGFFHDVKNFLEKKLDIEPVCEIKELRNYYKCTYYNVKPTVKLNKEISSISEKFIVGYVSENCLEVSIRKI